MYLLEYYYINIKQTRTYEWRETGKCSDGGGWGWASAGWSEVSTGGVASPSAIGIAAPWSRITSASPQVWIKGFSGLSGVSNGLSTGSGEASVWWLFLWRWHLFSVVNRWLYRVFVFCFCFCYVFRVGRCDDPRVFCFCFWFRGIASL